MNHLHSAAEAGRPVPRALTVAGSDSGGGAGIQADLKVFFALGTFGISVITALTAQNTVGVRGVHAVPPEFVRQQLDAVVEDIGVDALKTGMLSSAPIIEAVASGIRRHDLKDLVVDPVMVAKSGDLLLAPEARESLMRELLPLARVITPNLHETRVLTGVDVRDRETMREAARRLKALGPETVVVKGGHLAGSDRAIDLLYDGERFVEFSAPRFDSRHTHGTGCTFSAAITANLALGHPVPEAVRRAKALITAAIRAGIPVGRGHGPTDPAAFLADPDGALALVTVEDGEVW